MTNIDKEIVKEAYDFLISVKGYQIYARIVSVAKSGLSRRMEFAIVKDNHILNITQNIATALAEPYDYGRGMNVKGCGMDMIFYILTQLNYALANHEGRPISGEGNAKFSYANAYFDANKYRRY